MSTEFRIARPERRPRLLRRRTRFPRNTRSLGALGVTLCQESHTFMNPIVPAHSADPWMVFHEGLYYYCESRNSTSLYVRKSKNMIDIAQDEGVRVWTAPFYGTNSKNLWAPELHFLNGKWFIYFAADDGENENHRMWVLESETSDPQGNYLDRGCLETSGWAIDGTLLITDDGKLNFVWSGWPGASNGRQNLYIAPMRDPLTVAGPRTLICSPDQSWETVDMAIAEGPQVLQRNGLTFIAYSASGSWTVDYCLGLLVNRDGNVLNPASWEKHGPVFQKTPEVWGVGHCSFIRSPDQNEDWILYHAKSKRKKGWLDRNVHAQAFTWEPNGFPQFGKPWPAGIPHLAPSGTGSL